MEYMHAGTTYAINPTIEEIIRECDAAWEQARGLRREFGLGSDSVRVRETIVIAPSDRDGDDESKEESIYITLARDHSDMNKTYPVILAAMSTGSYDKKAVRKFFGYVKNHPWRTEEEFLDVQSVYNTMLFRATHPHANQKSITRTREHVRAALTENEKNTKEQIERAQREAEEINARRAKERFADMIARVPRDSAILLNNEVRPIIVRYDDSQ